MAVRLVGVPRQQQASELGNPIEVSLRQHALLTHSPQDNQCHKTRERESIERHAVLQTAWS